MRLLKAFGWTTICLTSLCAAAYAQKPFDIAWSGERLSVRAVNAPLADIMIEVARVTGIEVDGADKLAARRVSLEFTDLAPQDAFGRLLEGVNYVIQRRKGTTGKADGPLAVTIHSVDGYALRDETLSGPILIKALDLYMAVELNDVTEMRKEEEEDDPDVVEDRRVDKARALALAAEGAFSATKDIETLVKFMSDANEEVRLETLKAIGTRPLEGLALKAIVETLGDETWEVRNAAVDILSRATDAESLRAVGQTVRTSHDRDVRIDALRVLAFRAQPESAPHLRETLKTDDAVIRDIAGQILAELDRREAARRASER